MLNFSVPFAVLVAYTLEQYKEFLRVKNPEGGFNPQGKRFACEILHAILVLEKLDQEINGVKISFDLLVDKGPGGKDARSFAKSLATQVAEKGWEKISFKQTKYVLRFAHLLHKEGLAILNHKVTPAPEVPVIPAPAEGEPTVAEILRMLEKEKAKNMQLRSAASKVTTRFRKA